MLANLLFPITCVSCNKAGEYLCKDCRKKLVAHPEICPICHRYSPHYRVCPECVSWVPIQGLIVAFSYQTFLKKLIIGLKYKHQKSIVDFLVQRLFLTLQTNEVYSKLTPENTILTYVPSHWYRRYFIKGYNQSLILAKKLSEISGFPFVEMLKKTKHTKSQVKLDRSQRQKNIENKFILDEKNISKEVLKNKKYIFIIDDITTTGSTILELAKIIKKRYPAITIRWLVAGRHNN